MSITLEEIIEYCKNEGIRTSYWDRRLQKEERNIIRVSWKIGEASGGSCWSAYVPEYKELDASVPQFVHLNNIISKFCPSLPYKKLKRLSNHIHEGSYSVYEYYGNYERFSYQEVKLSDIVDFINEL